MSQMLTSCRFSGVSVVTILVGKNKTPFQIHQDQLCEASSFFKAAFEGQFREGSEKKMDLPEEDVHLFDLFVQWLYHQRYEIPPKEVEQKGERLMEPVKLYVLADKYDVSDLRSDIITKLFALGNMGGTYPDLGTMAYAYEHVSPKSGLCRLLADWYACKVTPSWFSSDVAQKWFPQHPQVTAAVISSFVTTVSRATQTNPFAGEMPDKYKVDVQGASK